MIYNTSKRFLPIYKQSGPQPGPDYSTMPITFEALNGASTIKLAQTGSPYSANLSYKKKDGSWTPYTVGTTISLTDVGDTVSFSGSNTGFSKGFQNNYYNFQSTGNYQMVYGNLMSLVNWQTQIGANMFDVLFKYNTYLVDASNLILPNNTATQCYVWFIANCSNLSAAPYFRSPSFSQGCYWAMCEYSNLRKFRMDATGTPPGGSTLLYTLQSNSNLSALEVHFDSWNDNKFLSNIPNSAGRILIKSPSTPKTSLLSNWTTLNRDSNGVLWNTDSSGNSTTQYTGEDPFADYN